MNPRWIGKSLYSFPTVTCIHPLSCSMWFQDHSSILQAHYPRASFPANGRTQKTAVSVCQDLNQPANSLTERQDHPWLQRATRSRSEQNSIPPQDFTAIENRIITTVTDRTLEIRFFRKFSAQRWYCLWIAALCWMWLPFLFYKFVGCCYHLHIPTPI